MCSDVGLHFSTCNFVHEIRVSCIQLLIKHAGRCRCLMMLKCETTLCRRCHPQPPADHRILCAVMLHVVTVLRRAINACAWNNWHWLKFRHDSPDSQTSLWTHICMFTYAVMSFASTDGRDLEAAFSGFAGVADEMYRLTFCGCYDL